MKNDIDKYIANLLLEKEEERWIVIVAEIVKRFGSSGLDKIIEAIKKDPLTAPDNLGIKSLQNSPKWNSLALTYMQIGDTATATKIFEALLSRETENSATQNNYGVALMRAGKLPEAEGFFGKAFETDKKRDPDQAKKWPAYNNLALIKGGKPFSGTEITAAPSFHNILFMDIVGFSRPSWYGRLQVEKITYLTDTVRTLLGQLGVNFLDIPMLPTGDGMALLFENVEHPIRLAIELTKSLDKYNETKGADMKIELRIGIHAGDSFPVKDLHGGGNRCGPAINTARRVLDLGQARQVLCSHEYGERLKRLFGPKYSLLLHDCGTYKVKHSEEIHIYNIWGGSFGNSDSPPQSKLIMILFGTNYC